jgi:hypothetical protein
MLSNREAPGFDSAKIILSLDSINKKQVSYLAMGDSFASGEGDLDDSWYEEGTDEKGLNLCHLSKRSYPYLLADDLGIPDFYSVACSGARQEHVSTTVQYENSRQNSDLGLRIPGRLTQHEYLDINDASFLTISIGGNDMGFGSTLLECLMPGTCKYETCWQIASQPSMKTSKKLMVN